VRILALDLSTKTGWALFESGKLIESGTLEKVEIHDFNVNKHPNKSPYYPNNIFNAALGVGGSVCNLIHSKKSDFVVIENSVKGRNRHTQRLIEWVHFAVLDKILGLVLLKYMDPSEWRKIVDLKLSKADKDNNKAVKKKEKRGKITRKHLSVRMVNEKFGKSLKIKDNDEADAILLGFAATVKYGE
jgi:hypothetical protein